jgi:TolB protein
MRLFHLPALVAICAIGLACHGAGGADRLAIAVVPFGVSQGSSAPPVDVSLVIRADLATGDRFALIDTATLPSQPTRLAEVRFEDWRRLDVDYLVVGRVAHVHDGSHEVEFRLLDVRTQQELSAFTLPSAPHALGHTAHEIAQRIEERLSG